MQPTPSRRRSFCLAAAATAAAATGLATAPRAFAQTAKYPTRAVKLIVPSPPGGGPDIVGRLLTQLLSQKWGQQLLIENIGGASATRCT